MATGIVKPDQPLPVMSCTIPQHEDTPLVNDMRGMSSAHLWRTVGPGILYVPMHPVSTFNCRIRALWQRIVVAIMRISSVD